MDIAEINALDATIKHAVLDIITRLENILESDIVYFYGQIHDNITMDYRKLIQDLHINGTEYQNLTVFLNTPGGMVEAVERYANINRQFYKKVYFVVPNQAMSAGTVFCMSGDRIYMDYASALGPIDPQIFNGERYVPALGYLDKIRELVQKAESGKSLNSVDVFFLQRQDVAFLRMCEQQSELTTDLIRRWLVDYNLSGVTDSVEREKKADDIANTLGDNMRWRSHGRYINIKDLREMGLDIFDYNDDVDLAKSIREYDSLLTSYIQRNQIQVFLNSKYYF